MKLPCLMLHGGMFHDRPDRRFYDGLERIAPGAYERLEDGKPPVSVVCHAVKAMEDDPVFNAGRGSFPQTDGVRRMDAACMDGSDLSVGAVLGLRGVAHPVAVAERLRTDGRTCILCGEPARQYARETGTFEPLEETSAAHGDGPPGESGGPCDTVGAVAVDAHGRCAVAVSTGGVRDARPGRVGDVPMAGCGFYADDELGAACMTGEGEHILRAAVALRAVNGLAGSGPQKAMERALGWARRRIPQLVAGGMVVSRSGDVGFSISRGGLYLAAVSAGELIMTSATDQRRI